MPSNIITTEVAASALGLTPQRVRQLAKELGIQPQTIGKALIFSPADLRKMQARNTNVGRPKKDRK
ncbi:MAG TPA: hypothetical protein VNN73_17585 [Blastocatellia bacterium]|nr:hypothetical protein [Blastocatellia bacterium]